MTLWDCIRVKKAVVLCPDVRTTRNDIYRLFLERAIQKEKNEMNSPSNFSTNLKILKKCSNLFLKNFAEEAKIPKSTIANFVYVVYNGINK